MIPGILISIITFPGIVVHEWAHKKFCDWLKVSVLKVVYFRFGNPAGYVQHEQPIKYNQIFWISIGPLIVNSGITLLLGFLASQVISESFLYDLLVWLALSIGMHSFPSDQDMTHISSASKSALKENGSFLHYFAFPFVWLVWIANVLKFFWFDAAYAVLLISLVGGFK